MKTALITNYWKNSDGGGVKTYLVNLVDAMEKKGADVSVLFRWGDDPEHFCGRYSQSEDINSRYNYIVSLARF